MEKYLLTRVLRVTEGNQSKAAMMLGITRGSLRNKIHSLGIPIGQLVTVETMPTV
jgi:two-component system nitrogen regulation response regulator GlnG